MPKFSAIEGDRKADIASINGHTKPVSLSIARSENKEALPFLILASIAKELFRDWFNSIPTCVMDSL